MDSFSRSKKWKMNLICLLILMLNISDSWSQDLNSSAGINHSLINQYTYEQDIKILNGFDYQTLEWFVNDLLMKDSVKYLGNLIINNSIDITQRKKILDVLTFNVRKDTALSVIIAVINNVPPVVIEPAISYSLSNYSTGKGYSPYSGASSITTVSQPSKRTYQSVIHEYAIGNIWLINPYDAIDIFFQMEMNMDDSARSDLSYYFNYYQYIESQIISSAFNNKELISDYLTSKLKNGDVNEILNSVYCLRKIFTINYTDPLAIPIIKELINLLGNQNDKIKYYARMGLSGISKVDYQEDLGYSTTTYWLLWYKENIPDESFIIDIAEHHIDPIIRAVAIGLLSIDKYEKLLINSMNNDPSDRVKVTAAFVLKRDDMVENILINTKEEGLSEYLEHIKKDEVLFY